MDELKIIACWFDGERSRFDDYENHLKKYSDKYLIAFETTRDKKEKPHFHFLFEGTDTGYANMAASMLRKYKLKSVGKGNKKYGKVTNIRTIEGMCSYTLKQGDYRTAGFTEEEVKEWYANSFDKKKPKDISADIFEFLDQTIPNYSNYQSTDYEVLNDEKTHTYFPQPSSQNYFNKICKKIIEYIIDQELQVGSPKPYVSRHAYLWIQNTTKLSKKIKISILCDLII